MRMTLACAIVLASTALGARGDLAADTERVLNERQMKPTAIAVVNFLELAMNGKVAQMQRLFKAAPRVQEWLERGDVADLLRRVNFQRPYQIDLVGFSKLGQSASALVYVATTADGPIGIKVCVYRHDGTNYIDRVYATAEWHEIEAMIATVDKLPASLVVSMKKEEGAQDK